jgi:hypothetical protein
MGLTSWESARGRKDDVCITRNYMHEEKLRPLNHLTEQYLIFPEGQATRNIAMTRQDWISKRKAFDPERLPDFARRWQSGGATGQKPR